MMAREKRKDRYKSGFSFTETLVAVAILLLATSVVAAGSSTISHVYHQAVFAAQARTLESTIDGALSDPLRFMQYDETTGAYTLVYQSDYSADNMIDSTSAPALVADPSSGQLYFEGKNAKGTDVKIKLLNSGAYGGCTISAQDGATSDNLLDLSALPTVTVRLTIHDSSNTLSYPVELTYRQNDLDKDGQDIIDNRTQTGIDAG